MPRPQYHTGRAIILTPVAGCITNYLSVTFIFMYKDPDMEFFLFLPQYETNLPWMVLNGFTFDTIHDNSHKSIFRDCTSLPQHIFNEILSINKSPQRRNTSAILT